MVVERRSGEQFLHYIISPINHSIIFITGVIPFHHRDQM